MNDILTLYFMLLTTVLLIVWIIKFDRLTHERESTRNRNNIPFVKEYREEHLDNKLVVREKYNRYYGGDT